MNHFKFFKKKALCSFLGVAIAVLMSASYGMATTSEDATHKPKVVSEGPYSLGENPVWNETTHCLLFTNIHVATIYEYCPDTGQTNAVYTGLPAFGLTVNEDGALIIGTPIGLYYVNYLANPVDVRPLAPVDPETGHPIWVNEQVAVNGGVYFGDVYSFDGSSFGSGNLFWIGPDRTLRKVATGRYLPNGLGVSPDQTKLYFAASVDRKIYRFDINATTGELSNEITFATLPNTVGIFDGLTVNAAGDVIVAVWYSGKVYRYGSNGALLETIDLPVLQPSNVTFGGNNYKDMYITTASGPFPLLAPPGFDNGALNLGGAVYRLKMPVPGMPEMTSNITPPPLP